MKIDIIEKLTSKDNKEACSFMQKVVNESQKTNKWYSYFDECVSLLNHSNSLVRNRAIAILAANAKWDDKNKFELIIEDYLVHINDEKPITSRQCIKALVEIGQSKPKLIPTILNKLQATDISQYNDSMKPLIENDIIDTINILTKMIH